MNSKNTPPTSDTLLLERLSNCQREQLQVTVHLPFGSLTGIVVSFDNDFLELKKGSERTMIRIGQIAALSSN